MKGNQSDFHATLETWNRINGTWQTVDELPATVGRNGIATPEDKKEGDGKTPAGLYTIERAFGYAKEIKTGLNYHSVGENDLWIDDASSPDYNLWVAAPTKAKSFEELRRKDNLYEIAAVIEYNTKPVVPGKGSAIFFHVWGGKDRPTAGCVAIEKSKLAEILKWLDRSKRPMIMISIQK